MTRAVATPAAPAPPSRVENGRFQSLAGLYGLFPEPHGGNQASNDAKFISSFDIHMRRIPCGYVGQSRGRGAENAGAILGHSTPREQRGAAE